MFMKRLFLSILAVFSLCLIACAQTESESTASANRFWDKVDKLDAYNMILPLLMTKEQIRKILPSIEKARERVRTTLKTENEELRRLETKVDAAMSQAADKGAVPSHELISEIYKERVAIAQRRLAMAAVNAEDVTAAVKTALNAGQLKVAENSLNPKDFDPGLKVEEMKPDDKLILFSREILLMPQAYDILVKLSM